MDNVPDPNSNIPILAIFAIISLVILLILSAFFSLTETAFTAFNHIRMENMAKKSSRARLVLKLSDHYDTLLSTILIGNNLTNIASSAIATLLFINYLGDIGPTIATIVVTIVVLIFGEVSPKTLAREHPETLAKLVARPIFLFYIIFYPISFLLSLLQKLIKKIFKSKKNEEVYTEEEFSMLVEDLNEAKVLNDIEEGIIQNTIEYGDTKVADIMIEAKDVHYVSINDGFDAIVKKVIDCNRSRLVVCKNKSLNSAYAYIHAKDLFPLMANNDKNYKKVIMTDTIICKPTHKISRLFKKMQSSHQHLAIVKDGRKVLGIVTMEDIIEELLGDIKDENDEE